MTTTTQEIGKGSPLKKWVCKCTTHVTSLKGRNGGRIEPGPQIIRFVGDNLVAFCPFCESRFERAPENPPKKRNSKRCSEHCPDGAHTHE